MLAVQEYLRSGKSLDSLTESLGIKVVHHPEDPLVILVYDQIDSPKTHPIVRECRGIVLEKDTWNLVAKPFNRFYNWGEVIEDGKLFDWSNFWTSSKEDGSLCIVYNYRNKWRVNTKGSFGLGVVNDSIGPETWTELFERAIYCKLQDFPGYQESTYVFELCAPHNKIVRTYHKPIAYLLTIVTVHDSSYIELPKESVDLLAWAVGLSLIRPVFYNFTSVDEMKLWLQECGSDPTFEGFVICDGNGQRWKVKSPFYNALHKMRGEGDNLYHPKYLLPYVLSGEQAELTCYFPEVEQKLSKVTKDVLDAFDCMMDVWRDSRDIESQKDFALAIVGKTKFSSILFQARKSGLKTDKELESLWRKSTDIILKVLF